MHPVYILFPFWITLSQYNSLLTKKRKIWNLSDVISYGVILKQYKALIENSLKQVVSRKAQKSRVQKNRKKT